MCPDPHYHVNHCQHPPLCLSILFLTNPLAQTWLPVQTPSHKPPCSNFLFTAFRTPSYSPPRSNPLFLKPACPYPLVWTRSYELHLLRLSKPLCTGYVWWLSASKSVLASLVDSLVDLASQVGSQLAAAVAFFTFKCLPHEYMNIQLFA